MNRDIKNTVGDADLDYLGEAKGRLGEGFTDETPGMRFHENTPYEIASDPGSLECVWPENDDAGGFVLRPGTGYKGAVKRN